MSALSGSVVEAPAEAPKRRGPRKPKPRPVDLNPKLLHGSTVARAMAAAMRPGCWYARPDIARAVAPAGVPGGSVRMVLMRMLRAGMVERRRNPVWRPRAYRKGEGIHITARGHPPEYLYRLTPAGNVLWPLEAAPYQVSC
jgi:hypothetical protein